MCSTCLKPDMPHNLAHIALFLQIDLFLEEASLASSCTPKLGGQRGTASLLLCAHKASQNLGKQMHSKALQLLAAEQNSA